MTREPILDYDSADHFASAEDQAFLIADAIEVGDPGYLAHALGIVARARGMTKIAEETGIKRQALYRALSKDGNPTLQTMMKLMPSLGLVLKIERAETAEA